MTEGAQVAAEEPASTKPRRGRRRDPSVDLRVTEAAIETYAQLGWAGFTFDEVARRARVGKAALYLRWPSKEELLLAAMANVQMQRVRPPEVDLHTELLTMAHSLFAFYRSTRGLAFLRFYVESRFMPALEERWRAEQTTPMFLHTRRLIRAAIDRGELPAGTSPTILIDALVGAIGNHILSTPPELYDQMVARSEDYLANLVEFVLAGARADGGSPAGQRSTPKPARTRRSG